MNAGRPLLRRMQTDDGSCNRRPRIARANDRAARGIDVIERNYQAPRPRGVSVLSGAPSRDEREVRSSSIFQRGHAADFKFRVALEARFEPSRQFFHKHVF